MPSVLQSLSKDPPSLEGTTLWPAVRQIRARTRLLCQRDYFARYLLAMQTFQEPGRGHFILVDDHQHAFQLEY